MTVQFIRFKIKGTNKKKIELIENWFNSKIEKTDLNTKLVSNKILSNVDSLSKSEVIQSSVFEDEFEKGNYVLIIDLYIKSSIDKSKYKNYLINKFKSFDKTGLTEVSLEVYDECSHDSDNPQPCKPVKVMSWEA